MSGSKPYLDLIAMCEADDPDYVLAIDCVADFLGCKVDRLLGAGAYLDAAVAMLPKDAEWRRYIDDGACVYAASPYNAKAQVRYDGFSKVPALAICAAHLRMLVAPILKAEADEARRTAKAERP